MEIQKNIPLGPYTTLGVGGPAEFFAVAENDVDIIEALEFAVQDDYSVTILGGGSNMLISETGIPGVVLHIQTKGIEITGENETEAIVAVAAGENWDDVVAWAVGHGLWGIENMSAIPGLIGAFASGNIGAYGQDASQVITNVEAFDILTQEPVIFSNEECNFSYRTSIFNSSEKGKYVITSVSIRLSKQPKANLEYKDLAQHFAKENPANIKPEAIRAAVIAIRAAKLPDPKIIGNAGSFFKNPIIDGVKQTAAALIDQVGLKGFAVGGAQVSPTHALVITNTGTATSEDVFNLAQHIRREVHAKTGVVLIPEPIFLGFSEEQVQDFYDLT